MRNALKYGASLIALYIVVANGSGWGQVITSGANGAVNLTKTLQGR
jgi:hypothetical protein